jgi:hypothetical protein
VSKAFGMMEAGRLPRSAGEVLHPVPGELLWDAGDPYDLYLVLLAACFLSIAGLTEWSSSSRKATSSASSEC